MDTAVTMIAIFRGTSLHSLWNVTFTGRDRKKDAPKLVNVDMRIQQRKL